MATLINALSLTQVQQRTSLSKTTIYRLISKGQFPKPIKITTRRVAWPESNINEWLANRPNA